LQHVDRLELAQVPEKCGKAIAPQIPLFLLGHAQVQHQKHE
jgi:hypothetical protein